MRLENTLTNDNQYEFNMTEEQKRLFQKLHDKKTKDISVLMDDDYVSIWRSTIEKYPESAHFVYELIQNADDANASVVSFILSDNQLIFKHNGTKHFDVSDVEDKKVVRGDINAICSTCSTKSDDEKTIGKFGVGFKSVFKYVNSPEIYDDSFRFRIDDYIVPSLLESDHPLRNEGETLFVFKFKEPEKAYNNILIRLRELRNPILYLNHLAKIEWKQNDEKNWHTYEKAISHESEKDGISCDYVILTSGEKQESLYLFTKEIELVNPENEKHVKQHINVAYYLNPDGSLNVKDKRNIYCFFETSDSYGMCYESHGPFLLTDNRNNILKDENANVNSVIDDEIGNLASQALLWLKDYKLLNENLFTFEPEKTQYLDKGWDALRQKFINKIKSNELVLSRDGNYRFPSKVRHAASPELENLVDKQQLAALLDANEDVDFIMVKDRKTLMTLIPFLQELGVNTFDNEKFADGITEAFMQNQSEKWIDRFYSYIEDYAIKLWKKSKDGDAPKLIDKPIIKTSKGKWVKPCSFVYLPNEHLKYIQADKYVFIDEQIYKNHTRFFDALGLKEPDELDFLKKEILAKYTAIWVSGRFYGWYVKRDAIQDDIIRDDFKVIFNIWKEANEDKRRKVERLLNENWYVAALSNEYMCKANKLLDDNDELRAFYQNTNREEHFVDFGLYDLSADGIRLEEIKPLFKNIGVEFSLQIYSRPESYYRIGSRARSNFDKQGKGVSDKEKSDFEDSMFEHLEEWPSEFTRKQSLLMWKCICGQSSEDLLKMREASCRAYEKYNTNKPMKSFESDSSLLIMLKNDRWIYDEKGKAYSVDQITIQQFFSFGYADCILTKDLGFKFDAFQYQPVTQSLKEDPFVGNQEQRDWQKLGKYVKDSGFGEDDMKEAFELLKRKREKEREEAKRKDESQSKPSLGGENIPYDGFVSSKPLDNSLGSGDKPQKPNESAVEKASNNEQETRKADGLEEFVKKQEEKIERERKKEDLKLSMENERKYSKKWFLDGLQREYLNEREDDSKDKIAKSVSISFSKVIYERDNVYCFKNPSQLIPRWLEELDGDLKVTLQFADSEEVNINFAMACVQDFSLRLRAKGNDESLLQKIDWEKLTNAVLDVNNPKGLVKNLRTAFEKLPFNDDFDLKANLKTNVKFVFGPPGTGKTYYLAHEIISKQIRERKECRILVLTPTNQAADVITKELLKANPDSCQDWLGRFVATNDQELEDACLVVSRESEIYKCAKCCVVSTIARLSYDFFGNENDGKSFLKDINWDYVVCDEGSMISLPEIMYAIHKFSYDENGNFTNVPIIIAGDPKQLQPIDSCEVWNKENIYDVVGLNSFACPHTEPVDFEVVNLEMQRRSVPAIGELFSRYSYDGQLQHYRKTETQLNLHLDKLDLKTITYFPFKVNNFDDIYGAKKINGSNIHVYSAIMTAKLCQYIAREYAENCDDVKLKIGVVCPYIAQVQLIDKLLSGCRDLPSMEIVEIKVGSIHSFQGDQCNVVFALFNPPKGMASKRQDMFTMLLNDDHLVNVAISRARDYLFVMVPSKDSFGRENLPDINRVVDVLSDNSYQYKDEIAEIDCSDLEKLLFGESDYLKKHSFITSHQVANVYSSSDYAYDIRMDKSAIDIQTNFG